MVAQLVKNLLAMQETPVHLWRYFHSSVLDFDAMFSLLFLFYNTEFDLREYVQGRIGQNRAIINFAATSMISWS